MAFSGRFIFTLVVAVVHRQLFARCVRCHHGGYKVRHFSCREQFLCLAFAQLTGRESLRDIEVCLNARPERRHRLGLGQPIARSTLAEANESRDGRIHGDRAQALIGRARELCAAEGLGLDLAATVCALDSTTIERWFSDGKRADVTVLDALVPEPGSLYVMDRGYLDFLRLHRFHQAGAFFVTRAKRGLRLIRIASRPVEFASGLRCDQTVRLGSGDGRARYPAPLRKVPFKDPTTGQGLVLLTDNFELPALSIATLYRLRWRVELFFKWIKGHLRIKAFYGTSANAVQTQVWVAICVYLMVAILKKELRLPLSLHAMLQVLGVNLFEKTPSGRTACASTSRDERERVLQSTRIQQPIPDSSGLRLTRPDNVPGTPFLVDGYDHNPLPDEPIGAGEPPNGPTWPSAKSTPSPPRWTAKQTTTASRADEGCPHHHRHRGRASVLECGGRA